MENLDEDRDILYKRTQRLNKAGTFIVEVSRTEGTLLVGAFDVGSPENYIIDLPVPKDEEIMKQFDGDYELLA